jgi:enamine deaminase RidA (YjgF/YER057c/UK114 family)
MSTSVRARAEQRLIDLAITLPAPPTPFGAYAEAVQSGSLLFLSGMLPIDGRAAAFVGRVGAELDAATAAQAARLAALNALAVAREYLGSLDRVSGSFGSVCRSRRREMFAISRKSQTVPRHCCRTYSAKRKPPVLVYGVASLPLGTPVELEIIFEVAG